jgi:V8-like Glu-specific endopeptidase
VNGDGESGLVGVEPVEGYVPISSNETAMADAVDEASAFEGLPVDADYADDPEFFMDIIKKLPKVAKVLKKGLGVAGSVVGSPVATAVGTALGIPPPVTAAVRRFLVRTAALRETEADDPDAQPSLLEVVIGADDRVRINNTAKLPWSGVCQLNIRAKNGQRFIGTGWLIAPRCVITAGHCVFIRSAGGWADRIEVSPGRNGASFPFGTVASGRFSALPRWVSHNDRNFDCGCIILPRPARAPNGASPFTFRYAARSDTAIKSRALNLSGYPGDKGGITQWFHARLAKAVSPSVITYDIDTAGGQSGSPVWHLENNARTAVGIHTNGSPLGNSATRITPAIKAQMDVWRAAGA